MGDLIKDNIKELGKHTLPRWNDFPDIELYMDQVIGLMQKYLGPYILPEDMLTPSMINNYVKIDVLPAPTKKRYSKIHLARLIVICLLKKQLSISTISAMIEKQVTACGMQKFFDSFVLMYEDVVRATAGALTENGDALFSAMSLAVHAAANHTVAENAVALILPRAENKKEQKKKTKSAE